MDGHLHSCAIDRDSSPVLGSGTWCHLHYICETVIYQLRHLLKAHLLRFLLLSYLFTYLNNFFTQLCHRLLLMHTVVLVTQRLLVFTAVYTNFRTYFVYLFFYFSSPLIPHGTQATDNALPHHTISSLVFFSFSVKVIFNFPIFFSNVLFRLCT